MSDRRQFIRGAAAALAASPAAWATPPVPRNGQAKFKFSLAAYSYRDLLKGENAPLTLHDFIDDCARMQLDGTELTSYYFREPVTPESIADLKAHAFRLGLDISGTAVGNDFGHPPGPQRNEQLEHVKRWIEHAERLDAPVIRIFAGHQQKGVSSRDTHALMVDGIQECCRYAEQHGIFLALENHGGPTATAAGLLSIVRDVDSPAFGVNLDTGNFHSEDIYGELEQIAPYALNVQVKVAVSGPDGKKRPSDYKRLAEILRNVHYRGYVVLEYEEGGDAREACPAALDELRTAMGN